ncbi:hypothetical protein B0J11DRAFT_436617 [Dendryphion nanum]|uniref:Uncharacterized protein n=1 Tax=Dendryphion nanum TaxID=256645 RepID=A0A9P9IK52_9PLEO|nr:hypothetical protein B0J11DRAFT_436617 [Dendryphion nanum]
MCVDHTNHNRTTLPPPPFDSIIAVEETLTNPRTGLEPANVFKDNSDRKRRGHTKSRLGCITCKRRKVKYHYLMRSILALSGSHMALFIDDESLNIALTHRQHAIQGLHEAFDRWPPTAEEAHVMLACCYLLAFQSSYLPDAFQDHIINLRGCSFLAQMILDTGLKGMFSVEPNMKTSSLMTSLNNFPFLDQGLAKTALCSLATISPLVKEGSAIEKALYAQLIGCIRPLVVFETPSPQRTPTPDTTDSKTETTFISDAASPFSLPTPTIHLRNPLFPSELAVSYEELLDESFGEFGTVPPSQDRPNVLRSFDALMSSLLILTTWPQEDVLHLLSPTNKLGCLVMIHFTFSRFIISPLSAPKATMRTPVKAMVEWAEILLNCLHDDDEMKWSEYLKFPKSILKTMRLCLNHKRGFTFGDLHDVVVNDPGAFLEGRMARL